MQRILSLLLRGGNLIQFCCYGRMSALGQKQTYAPQQVMSALPPIATAKADILNRSCPLYHRKRTCAVHAPMSAMGQ